MRHTLLHTWNYRSLDSLSKTVPWSLTQIKYNGTPAHFWTCCEKTLGQKYPTAIKSLLYDFQNHDLHQKKGIYLLEDNHKIIVFKNTVYPQLIHSAEDLITWNLEEVYQEYREIFSKLS